MKRVATSSLNDQFAGPSSVILIVVVNPAEIREFQVSGQRGCLAADPFHQIAVPAHRVHIEVENFEARDG